MPKPEPMKKRLAADLQEKQGEHTSEIVTRLEQGYYNEYDGPLDTPIVQLVEDLMEIGEEDIASDVANGEYDD